MTSNNEVVVSDNKKFLPAEHKEVQTDLDYIRKNMYDYIETGTAALQEFADIARQQQHPRAFEVLSGMLKQLSEMNKDLADLTVKKREETNPQDKDKENQPMNNLFVGSTKEFAQMMETIQKKKKPDA